MIRKPDEDLFKDTTMTFGEHLEELRICLWRALIGIIIGFLVGLLFANDVIEFIKTPMENALSEFYSEMVIRKVGAEIAAGKQLPYTVEQLSAIVAGGMLFEIHYVYPPEVVQQLDQATEEPESPQSNEKTAAVEALTVENLKPIFLFHPVSDDQRIRLIGLSVQDSFMIWIKAALLVGLTLAAPWVFYQIWTFVAAGLYPHEKKYVHIFLPFSLGLFALGASVAFLFVFEPVLNFLLSFYADMDIDPDQRITDWLSFVLILPLGFGISFQLPLVMLFLERIGIFDVKAYVEKWRIAILAIFVIAMILTPADPYSMLLMAVPLTFLYFGGVLLCRYLPKGKNPFDPA
jgi:sec-independent protein translocase protein TatC